MQPEIRTAKANGETLSRRTQLIQLAGWLLLCCASSTVLEAQGVTEESVAEIAGPGVRYWTELEVGGKIGTVPVRSGYLFCPGDAAALVFEADEDIHAMVLVQEESPFGNRASWKMALGEDSAQTIHLPRDTRTRVPIRLEDYARRGLRDLPLTLILSKRNLDLSPHLSSSNSKRAGRHERAESEEDVPSLVRLKKTLQKWRRNTVNGENDEDRRERYLFALDPSSPGALETRLEIGDCERRISLEVLNANR